MKILRKHHIITGNEYFRQVEFCPYDSDNLAVSKYISKWTSIRYLLGPVWKNRPLSDLDEKDSNYPYMPAFTDTYEFILFDDENELLSANKFIDANIKEIDGKMHGCYRLWNDWGEYFINTCTSDELDFIINTPANLCPCCNKGIIVERHGKFGKFNGCSEFPKCNYSEKKKIFSDYHFQYQQRKDELEYLKRILETINLTQLKLKFLSYKIEIQ